VGSRVVLGYVQIKGTVDVVGIPIIIDSVAGEMQPEGPTKGGKCGCEL